MSTKGVYRTSRGRVVCRLCLKSISKTGNIRQHFDHSHQGAEPSLLKEVEAHRYEAMNEESESSCMVSRYPDQTDNTGYVTDREELLEETLQSAVGLEFPSGHLYLGQKRGPSEPSHSLRNGLLAN